MYAPVAQLDRVTGYEPVGRGFIHVQRVILIIGTRNETPISQPAGRSSSGATVRWTVALLRRESLPAYQKSLENTMFQGFLLLYF